MKRLLVVAGALALAALLSACGSKTADLTDAPDLKAAAEEDKTAAQKLADELLGAVTGPADRAARACMILGGVAEIMTDRVVTYDTDYAATAFGNIAVLEGAFSSWKSADPIYFETDLAYIKLRVTRMLIDAGRARVENLIGIVGGGFNISGALERAAVVARQTELSQAYVKDLRNVVAGLNAGTLDADGVEAACLARFARNKARLAVLVGVSTPVVP